MKRIWLGAILAWEFMRYALASLLDPASGQVEQKSKSKKQK